MPYLNRNSVLRVLNKIEKELKKNLNDKFSRQPSTEEVRKSVISQMNSVINTILKKEGIELDEKHFIFDVEGLDNEMIIVPKNLFTACWLTGNPVTYAHVKDLKEYSAENCILKVMKNGEIVMAPHMTPKEISFTGKITINPSEN